MRSSSEELSLLHAWVAIEVLLDSFPDRLVRWNVEKGEVKVGNDWVRNLVKNVLGVVG